MFDGCSSLTSLDVTGFKTDNVTDMSSMFSGCSGLTSLDVSNFKTDNVTDMRSMFYGCSGLTNLDVSNFKTDNVTNMHNMFYGCSGLTSLDVTGFKTDKVTSMWNMFARCSGLTNLDLTGFKTDNVTNMSWYVLWLFRPGRPSMQATDGLPQRFKGWWKICSQTVQASWAGPEQNMMLAISTTPMPASMEEATIPATSLTRMQLIKNDVDEITIKDIGKTTWCSEYDLDFTNVAGIKAYTATGYDDIDKTIWLTRVMKVPAGTGLLVKGDAGTYKIPHAKVRAITRTCSLGNLGEAIQIEETDGDKTNYYLSGKDGTFVSVNGNANIGKNKAYLQLPTSVFAGTRSIGISYDDEDGTTGVKEVKSGEVKGEKWYTLQGQRVVEPR